MVNHNPLNSPFHHILSRRDPVARTDPIPISPACALSGCCSRCSRRIRTNAAEVPMKMAKRGSPILYIYCMSRVFFVSCLCCAVAVGKLSRLKSGYMFLCCK